MIGSRQPQCNQQNQEPGFFVDLLRNRISTFLLKERSKPVSYKKKKNIVVDADQKNEKETKLRRSTETKKGNPQWQQQ